MFGLKSVYFYLIACQIILIKFFKKIYFSSKNYNKSLETESPKQKVTQFKVGKFEFYKSAKK